MSKNESTFFIDSESEHSLVKESKLETLFGHESLMVALVRKRILLFSPRDNYHQIDSATLI